MKKFSILSIIMLLNLNPVFANDDSDGEKCYCLTRDAGGTKAGDCNEYILVPKGSCLDIGGSLVKGQKPVG